MLKKLASETVIYGGSTILARLLNYALVPLHTGVFATDSYGIVSEFYAYAAVLNILYTYGMETAYFRFATKNGQLEKQYFELVVTSLILTSIVFSALLIAFSAPIAQLLGYPDGQKFIVWFALLLAVDTIVAIPFARLRMQHKAVQFAAIKLGNISCNVLLNVFFLVICPDILAGKYLVGLSGFIQSFYDPTLGLGYAFFSNLLANVLVLPMLWKSFVGFRPRFSWHSFKPLLRYGAPIIFSGLAFSINEVSDRVLLKYWLPLNFYADLNSLDAVGIYSACYKLSIFITLAVQAYRYAAEPFFFKEANSSSSDKSYADAMHYFIIVVCLMMLGVSANLDWVAKIFISNDDYLKGLRVVPILLFANIFLGIYYNLAVWFKVTDRTQFGAFISGGGAIITLSANFFLIPILGYFGSAFATLLCYSSMAVACYFTGRNFYPVPYRLLPALLYLATAAMLSGIMVFVLSESSWWILAIKNVIVLFALFLVFSLEKKNLGIQNLS